MEYEELVFFQGSLCFIGKQILNFHFQNWQFGCGSEADQSILYPYTLLLKIYAIIIEAPTARPTS
jgi:hypothetical protein